MSGCGRYLNCRRVASVTTKLLSDESFEALNVLFSFQRTGLRRKHAALGTKDETRNPDRVRALLRKARVVDDPGRDRPFALDDG